MASSTGRGHLGWPAYGINGLIISESQPSADGQSAQLICREAPSWVFTLLASAINIGIKILETPQGRQTLERLGRRVVRDWHARDGHRFGGDVNQMPAYVNHFLSALRQSFPQVTVERMGGPEVLAAVRRLPSVPGYTWNGDLNAYVPKRAVGISFNLPRVADMIAAATVMGQTGPSARAREEGTRMAKRHKGFQFMFAVATAHELCHAFVGYLAQNNPAIEAYTPPDVSYLNYQVQYEGAPSPNGESGRWFEGELFGGSLEYYRDPNDNHGQVGIPYILDRSAVARQVSSSFITSVVEDPSSFQFPFPTTGNGISERERARRGMRNLGDSVSGAPFPAGILYMRARRVGPELMYNVPGDQLQLIPISPRPLQAQRVPT